MNFIKRIIKKYFVHLTYFYRHLGYRLFSSLIITVLVGTLDGFGLAMFLPLLQMVDGGEVASTKEMGNLAFLPETIQALGFTLNLFTICMVMMIFFLLKGIAKFFEGYYKVIIQQFFIKKLRVNGLKYLTQFDFELFIKADVGRIQNTLSGETGRVVQSYRYYFQAVQAIVLLLVYIVMAFLSNPQFALLVSVGGFLSNLFFRVIYKRTKAISRKITETSHSYQGLLIQKVAFYKYLKATGLSKFFEKKLVKEVNSIEGNNLKIGYYNSLINSIREPVIMAVVLSLIIIQVNVVGQSLGTIVLALLFFYRALIYIIQVQNHWNHFLNVSGSLENMTAFHEELKAGKEIQGDAIIEKFNNSIELNNVSFWYNPEDPFITNINLVIKANKTIAFVGESGSGKTTLVNIIAGLLPAKDGFISVDGIDYKNLNRVTLQKRIGYITQEPVIFNDSIFNNVTLWDEQTSENIEKFKSVIKKAFISDYVFSLSDTYKTVLGNNGINLSGGQRQRISIARELYKDIDILIMDEATSALDSETEFNIQQAIENLKGIYTIIIVAHRLSTIKSADYVALMHQGKMQSYAPYSELVENDTRFKKMIELQAV